MGACGSEVPTYARRNERDQRAAAKSERSHIGELNHLALVIVDPVSSVRQSPSTTNSDVAAPDSASDRRSADHRTLDYSATSDIPAGNAPTDNRSAET